VGEYTNILSKFDCNNPSISGTDYVELVSASFPIISSYDTVLCERVIKSDLLHSMLNCQRGEFVNYL